MTVPVDPERARQLLERSACPPIDVLKVKQIAEQMKAGQFRSTLPIRLNTHCIVVDGYHRLSAVIQSGATVTFELAFERRPF